MSEMTHMSTTGNPKPKIFDLIVCKLPLVQIVYRTGLTPPSKKQLLKKNLRKGDCRQCFRLFIIEK